MIYVLGSPNIIWNNDCGSTFIIWNFHWGVFSYGSPYFIAHRKSIFLRSHDSHPGVFSRSMAKKKFLHCVHEERFEHSSVTRNLKVLSRRYFPVLSETFLRSSLYIFFSRRAVKHDFFFQSNNHDYLCSSKDFP